MTNPQPQAAKTAAEFRYAPGIQWSSSHVSHFDFVRNSTTTIISPENQIICTIKRRTNISRRHILVIKDCTLDLPGCDVMVPSLIEHQ